MEQALATIRPGSRIYLGSWCAAPRNLLGGLEAMHPSPPDLEFVSFVTTLALPMKTNASHRHRTLHRPAKFGCDRRRSRHLSAGRLACMRQRVVLPAPHSPSHN